MRDALRVLQDKVDQRVRLSIETVGSWPCRKGCDSCCRSLARIPELTLREAKLLRDGFRQLPQDLQSQILAHLRCVDPGQEYIVCPLLDGSFGTCTLYA